ncbi:hypothetical protein [Flavobacterium marginilacus]|uniref:hypothetical protein n=1 Tax=Flavobacterium marginilacus TaxID=3003256 RepID=UPI00248EA72C|nr:hypothetical protein [Flavobacterium marginilacus]
MKKCIVLLLVLFAIAACKKGEVNTVEVQTDAVKAASLTDSLTLEDYDTIKDIAKKADWLREKGDRVKRKILEAAVLRDHKLKSNIIRLDETYTISWKKLKGTIGSYGYDKYLIVEHRGKKIDTLKMVDRFIPNNKAESQYRFSTTLIRTLAKVDGKNDDKAEFKFSFALIEDETKKSQQTAVVIQVNGNPYYDYSTDPKKVGEVPTLTMPL